MVIFLIAVFFLNIKIVNNIILSLALVSFILFFYGFVILGVRYKRRLLRVISWLFIVLGILGILFQIALLVFPEILEGIFQKEAILGIKSVGDIPEFVSEILAVELPILILGTLLLLIIVVFGILFGVRVLKLRDEVKFAKIVGILNIVGFSLLLVGIGIFVLFASLIFEIILLFGESKK